MRPIQAVSGALAVLLLWCLVFPLHVTAGEQRLFWKAESSAGVVWLLGSLHFGDPSMYPLPAAISRALASSDLVAVEVDVSAHTPESIAGMFSRRGLYHDGRRLEDVVDEAVWDSLAEAAADLGLPPLLFERQKPWYASMTLTMLALAREGFRSDLGIDMHVIALAAEHGLPVVELESIELQLDLLDGLSEAGQALMLAQSLEQLADTGRHFRRMLDAWVAGDAEALAEILVEGLHGPDGADEIYRALISERNDVMRRDIVRLLDDHDAVFVVVGAGHMVGEDGIVAGLAKEGFLISRPER
jgi:uncharacterized protein